MICSDDSSFALLSRSEAKSAGKLRYFTGVLCPRGHRSERFVSNRRCVACVRADKARWSQENQDHVAAYNKAHYRENAKVAIRRTAEWCRANPDRAREHKREDYRRHKESYRVRHSAYRAAHRDEIRAADRRKVEADPERYAAYKRNRKARKRNAPGAHSRADIHDILALQGGKCGSCRVRLRSKYHVDHIMPLAKGGSNDRRNLQILCAGCNQRKSAKDPIEFMREQGRLL